MKFCTIVGARPQFVKASALSRVLRKNYQEILIHTGQHYDHDLSDVFFKDLGIPEPDYNLKVGSARHGIQTGEIIKKVEEVLIEEEPDAVIVYGDTNSTLAGSLAAVKLHIPVAHIEAGLRSFNLRMPEEINRKVTDHISTILFCSSVASQEQLEKEGITKNVHVVGDIMHDVLKYVLKNEQTTETALLSFYGVLPKKYNLLTLHRAENTDNRFRLSSILQAIEAHEEICLFPIHPRTLKAMRRFDLEKKYRNILMVPPLAYPAMIALQKNARLVLTDSGGVQKEAYWLGVPCVTLRNETEWIETVEAGWNVLAGADTIKIRKLLTSFPPPANHSKLYGDGRTAQRCVEILSAFFNL